MSERRHRKRRVGVPAAWRQNIDDDPHASDGQMEAMRALDRQSNKRPNKRRRPPRRRDTVAGTGSGDNHQTTLGTLVISRTPKPTPKTTEAQSPHSTVVVSQRAGEPRCRQTPPPLDYGEFEAEVGVEGEAGGKQGPQGPSQLCAGNADPNLDSGPEVVMVGSEDKGTGADEPACLEMPAKIVCRCVGSDRLVEINVPGLGQCLALSISLCMAAAGLADTDPQRLRDDAAAYVKDVKNSPALKSLLERAHERTGGGTNWGEEIDLAIREDEKAACEGLPPYATVVHIQAMCVLLDVSIAVTMFDDGDVAFDQHITDHLFPGSSTRASAMNNVSAKSVGSRVIQFTPARGSSSSTPLQARQIPAAAPCDPVLPLSQSKNPY